MIHFWDHSNNSLTPKNYNIKIPICFSELFLATGNPGVSFSLILGYEEDASTQSVTLLFPYVFDEVWHKHISFNLVSVLNKTMNANTNSMDLFCPQIHLLCF